MRRTLSLCSRDPYNLQRFVARQGPAACAQALAEIMAGRKTTHWSWWMLPTAPFVIDGKEHGSSINREYALRDHAPNTLRGTDAAAAYLALPPQPAAAAAAHADPPVHLRQNYCVLLGAIASQLETGIRPVDLVGPADVGKLASSARLFEGVSRDGGGYADAEVNEVCLRCLARVGRAGLPGAGALWASSSFMRV